MYPTHIANFSDAGFSKRLVGLLQGPLYWNGVCFRGRETSERGLVDSPFTTRSPYAGTSKISLVFVLVEKGIRPGQRDARLKRRYSSCQSIDKFVL